MQHTSKRQKTASAAARPETALSLYKQATRLIRQQQCGDVASDAQIEAKLERALQLLAQGTQQHQDEPQTVAHSLDLELSDEPLYLAASTHLQLGMLFQRQDKLQEAEQQYRSSLKVFPRFVAALSALGQVLKAAAASPASLQEAQQVLQHAVTSAEQLSEEEGGLLVESNKGCAAELEAADAARAALAMLLCQAGGGRSADAAPHLKALGFKFRLADEVLCYHPVQAQQQDSMPAQNGNVNSSSGSSSSTLAPCSFMQVLDQALPDTLLVHLQHLFRPDAEFWREHTYGRVGYFSYFFQVDQAVSSSMHQLAHYLQQLGSSYFPDLQQAKFAEFWAHCRRHSSGHQLHFDSDNEGQGGARHPICTAIIYLSDNTHPAAIDPPAPAEPQHCEARDSAQGAQDPTSTGSKGGANAEKQQQQQQPSNGSSSPPEQTWIGGPTLMTDQVLGGPLATQGWLAYPATNRVAFFDGRYLHGVIPGRGPTPSEEGRRCTLMMAFWKDLKCRTPPGSGVGACMPMPEPTTAAADSWIAAVKPLPEPLGEAPAVPVPGLQHVTAVWQPVEGSGSTSGAAYQCCFQGF